jgi:hypothetical protein
LAIWDVGFDSCLVLNPGLLFYCFKGYGIGKKF